MNTKTYWSIFLVVMIIVVSPFVFGAIVNTQGRNINNNTSFSGEFEFTQIDAPPSLFTDGACEFEIKSLSENRVIGSGRWHRCGGYQWGQINSVDVLFTTHVDLSIGVYFTSDPFGKGFGYTTWDNLVGICPGIFRVNLQDLTKPNDLQLSCN